MNSLPSYSRSKYEYTGGVYGELYDARGSCISDLPTPSPTPAILRKMRRASVIGH